MRPWKYIIFVCFGLPLLAGCSLLGPSVQGNYTANTTAKVGGANGFAYSSNKNQESLKATGEMDPTGTVKFSIETTASTPEASIAAAAKSMSDAIAALSNVLQVVAPIVGSAIQGGLAGGGPGAGAAVAAKILTTPKPTGGSNAPVPAAPVAVPAP